MEEAFGLHEGAAPDADAEERSIRAVDANEARRVVVTWPGGDETRVDGVTANQRLVVERPQ